MYYIICRTQYSKSPIRGTNEKKWSSFKLENMYKNKFAVSKKPDSHPTNTFYFIPHFEIYNDD